MIHRITFLSLFGIGILRGVIDRIVHFELARNLWANSISKSTEAGKPPDVPGSP